MATFPSFKIFPESNLLAFMNHQRHLPFHRSWIVILGVLHGYAFRPGYGLPLGAAPDAVMEAGEFKNCLSGLLGMLLRRSTRGEQYYELSQVIYEMHTLPQLQQCLHP
jgi:hypothetical protein